MSRYYKAKKSKNPAKNTCDKNFSKYIRYRDALKTTGTLGYCKCITCEKIFPIAQIHAGHMIPGRTNGILFDETIVHGQCYNCNCNHDGEVQKYKSVMVAIHGEEWYDLKLAARRSNTFIGDDEYRLISAEYLRRWKELYKQYGGI